MIDKLPIPLKEELKLGKKVEYFNRLIGQGLHNKHKIELNEFADWIHRNYDSVFLSNLELTYPQFKKIK